MSDAGVAMGASAPAPRDAAARKVACGPLSCDGSNQESCCIGSEDSMSNGPPFSCVQDEASSCFAYLRCTSDDACAPGEMCCVDQSLQSVCRAASDCGGDAHLQCDTPDDCEQGQKCCAIGEALSPRATACLNDCGGGTPKQVCSGPDDCAPPQACLPSLDLPAIQICL